jgi:hypothetical protein
MTEILVHLMPENPPPIEGRISAGPEILMPPFTIDPAELWATIRRLADENDHSWRFTKKGDKRPAYDVEAQKQSRKATLAAKREARIARLGAAQRAASEAKRPKPGEDIASRMLRAMTPGSWYGMGDLMRLGAAARSGRSKVHQVLLRRKWIERARNPAWSDRRYSPQEIEAGAEPEPQHLYRLTDAGVAEQARLSNS